MPLPPHPTRRDSILRWVFCSGPDNRLDEATAEFQKELEINPHSIPATFYLGDIALTRNEYTKAEQLFTRVTQENTECVDGHLLLGKTYVRLNEPEKGLEEFKQAEKLDPNGADVHYWLATTYQRWANNQNIYRK